MDINPFDVKTELQLVKDYTLVESQGIWYCLSPAQELADRLVQRKKEEAKPGFGSDPDLERLNFSLN